MVSRGFHDLICVPLSTWDDGARSAPGVPRETIEQHAPIYLRDRWIERKIAEKKFRVFAKDWDQHWAPWTQSDNFNPIEEIA